MFIYYCFIYSDKWYLDWWELWKRDFAVLKICYLCQLLTRYFPFRQSSLLFYWQHTRFNIMRHRKCWLIFNKDSYDKDLGRILCVLFNIYFLASQKMRGPVIYEQFCLIWHLPSRYHTITPDYYSSNPRVKRLAWALKQFLKLHITKIKYYNYI